MIPTIGIMIGGDSRRMGRPKALIEVDGKTLIERTADTAATLTDRIVLLGDAPFDLPTGVTSLRVIEDLHPGIGPMAGLEALLAARPEGGGMLLSCDMPYLTVGLLRRLCDLPSGFDAAVAHTPDHATGLHPCCAIYRPSVMPAMQEAIAAGQYGMIKLLTGLRILPVELNTAEARWVENWNEPADLPPRT